jgi:hypothetical protein
VRDDLYPLTRAQRRAIRDEWRQIPYRDRRNAARLAERGLPAPTAELSAATFRWGQYMLQRNWSNRLPRSSMLMAGLGFAALGFVSMLVIDVGLPVIVCGLVAAAMGWVTWDVRRGAHQLIRANAVVPTGYPPS